MFETHIFVDGKLARVPVLQHCPRLGDTLRLSEKQFVIVTELVWCLDESSSLGQRVNIRTETDKIKGKTPSCRKRKK